MVEITIYCDFCVFLNFLKKKVEKLIKIVKEIYSHIDVDVKKISVYQILKIPTILYNSIINEFCISATFGVLEGAFVSDVVIYFYSLFFDVNQHISIQPS